MYRRLALITVRLLVSTICSFQIFADFFDEIADQFAAVDDQPARSGVKAALSVLFRKIFVTEFSLMNPLVRLI